MIFLRDGWSARARFLSKLLVLGLPLALALLALFYSSYDRDLEAVRVTGMSSTSEYARSVDRVLLDAAEEARSDLKAIRETGSGSCQYGDGFTPSDRSVALSVVMLLATGDECASGTASHLDKGAAALLIASLRSSARSYERGDKGWLYSYGLTTISNAPMIVVLAQRKNDNPNAPAILALALISPDRLGKLSGISADGGMQNDAVIADGKVFARLGGLEKIDEAGAGGSPVERGGPLSLLGSVDYLRAQVGGSGLSAALPFDIRAAGVVWRRFFFSCGGFLLVLLVTCLAVLKLAHSETQIWIRMLETAMPRGARPAKTLEIMHHYASARPEMREFIAIFDEWAATAELREKDLRSSVDANQRLLRELHHRVKNSLQVIQSYLALSRREGEADDLRPLLDAEARVRVLSIAYRLALTEHGMEPVPIKAFISELVGATTSSMRRPGQQVAVELLCDAEVGVDRAIPLGLGIVEALISALSGRDIARVDVELHESGPGLVAISVKSDASVPGHRPSARIMAGLAEQLRARALGDDPRDVLDWEFTIS